MTFAMLAVGLALIVAGIWLIWKKNGGPELILTSPIRLRINAGITIVLLGVALFLYPFVLPDSIIIDAIRGGARVERSPVKSVIENIPETIDEQEENDTHGLANSIAVGQTVHGWITIGDTDYFKIRIEGGKNVELAFSGSKVFSWISATVELRGKVLQTLNPDDSFAIGNARGGEYIVAVSSWRPYYVGYALSVVESERQ